MITLQTYCRLMSLPHESGNMDARHATCAEATARAFYMATDPTTAETRMRCMRNVHLPMIPLERCHNHAAILHAVGMPVPLCLPLQGLNSCQKS